MKILISVKNPEEARKAIIGNADIIDIKNPEEGSLGANFPYIIKEIVKISNENNKLCSVAIGDLDKAGTASLAALGAATINCDYIKVGLMTEDIKNAIKIMKNVVKATRNFANFYGEKIKIVACGYADWIRANTIPIEELQEIALLSNSDVVMIDTAIKDGKNLFDFLNEKQLINFVNNAKSLGLEVALAGSLKKEHISLLKKINPDIVGFRAAVCENLDRNKEINEELVRALNSILHSN